MREEKREKLRKLLVEKLCIEEIKDVKLKSSNKGISGSGGNSDRGSGGYQHHMAENYNPQMSPRRRAPQPTSHQGQNFKIMMFDT